MNRYDSVSSENNALSSETDAATSETPAETLPKSAWDKIQSDVELSAPKHGAHAPLNTLKHLIYMSAAVCTTSLILLIIGSAAS